MRPNPQETAYLVTFTEEILNGKLHLLCSVFKGFQLSKIVSVVTVSAPLTKLQVCSSCVPKGAVTEAAIGGVL